LVKIDAIEGGIKVKKVRIALDDELSGVVCNGLFKTIEVFWGANIAKSSSLGAPRVGHLVNKHRETSEITSANTGIGEKLLSTASDDAHGIGSKLIIIGGKVEQQKVNVVTGQTMEIGLRELDDNGSDGSVFSHVGWIKW
jgi:hypothetical protein